MSGWTIERLASPSQIDDVIAIEEASFTNPWTRAMYLAELDRPELSFCYLARDSSGGVLGFCSFWLVVDELHINNLAVVPGARRTGVGSALLRHVLSVGVGLRAVRATLEVRQSNEAARLLYARLGFVVAGVRRGYYSKPVEDAVVLWREGLDPGSSG
jgi:ribosomal-protein-alanine N-acetyltransferase